MSRLHPAASRVEQLSRETPAAYVAFDLLAIDDEDLREQPFIERRARLEELLGGAPPPVLDHGRDPRRGGGRELG